MTHLNVVIVDDEERGIVALKQLILRYCKGVTVVAEATNITDAVKMIRQSAPDIVFLDIEMPDGNGFQLFEQFDDIDFEVVFVTAYQEYAVKAIKFSAFDYLLKPVNLAELQDTIERIRNKILRNHAAQYNLLRDALVQHNSQSRIMLSTVEGYCAVKVEDIIYCKASDSYTHFYLSGDRHYVVSKNLKETEEMLDAKLFYRIHKSYLINLDHIDKVLKTDGISVLMSNKEELPVSFRKKEEFIKVLHI